MSLISILAWIIFGLIAGIVAKAISPGRDNLSWIWTVLLGIAGAVLGGFLGELVGLHNADTFSVGGFLLAVGGALLLLFVYDRVIAGRH